MEEYLTRDPFSHFENVKDRLLKEWKEHCKLIIAFDFDGTVYDYLQRGDTFPLITNLLRESKKIGAHIYCFTAREEHEHDFVRNYLNENDIPFDGINIDYDFIRFRGRKPYYNILLDDRAGLESALQVLNYCVNKMKLEEYYKNNKV